MIGAEVTHAWLDPDPESEYADEDRPADMGIGFVTELQSDSDATSDGEPRPNYPEAEAMLDELRAKDPAVLLREIHVHMLAELLAKLKTGIASHQELAIARNLLRDNGFTVAPTPDAVEVRQQEIARERTALPNLTEPEYDYEDEA